MTVDIDPFPAVNVDLNPLTVGYKSGEITVSVPYPELFWDETCVDTVIFGVVCIPYPNVRTSQYTFTIGTLTAKSVPTATPRSRPGRRERRADTERRPQCRRTQVACR